MYISNKKRYRYTVKYVWTIPYDYDMIVSTRLSANLFKWIFPLVEVFTSNRMIEITFPRLMIIAVIFISLEENVCERVAVIFSKVCTIRKEQCIYNG